MAGFGGSSWPGPARQAARADGAVTGHNRWVSGAVLPDDVMRVLVSDATIRRVELTESRARGAATALSDLDFTVTTAEFDAVRDALPLLTASLRPVVAQWERLSRNCCYMMILGDPAKVDLLFDWPHPVAVAGDFLDADAD